MKVFEASGPTVEILGDAIIPVLKGIPSVILKQALLKKHGLEGVVKQQFYSQQTYLNLLREVDHDMPLVLMNIGRNIFTEAVFPPDIDDFEKAIFSVDTAYHMNHRGGEIGHYQARKIDRTQYEMMCDNPFPCNFDIGIIQGIALAFNQRIFVRHTGKVCRMKGDDHCLYGIHVL